MCYDPLGLPLLIGDQDDPLPLHLHVRGDHVQITLQFIKVWSVAMLWSIWWVRSGSALNWLSWIRIWIRTGNADPDPEALTKLTNKIVLLPFKNALYLLRKVHIFFAYNLLYCSTQYFSYINSTFGEFKVWPGSGLVWVPGLRSGSALR
jgi:hypothetical protein